MDSEAFKQLIRISDSGRRRILVKVDNIKCVLYYGFKITMNEYEFMGYPADEMFSDPSLMCFDNKTDIHLVTPYVHKLFVLSAEIILAELQEQFMLEK